MAESFIVRRGGSGRAGELAIFTGSTLPSNEEYGIFCNTGTSTVDSVIIDYVVTNEYTLENNVMAYSPTASAPVSDSTEENVYYHSGRGYLYEWNIESNISTVSQSFYRSARGISMCFYTDDIIYLSVGGYDSDNGGDSGLHVLNNGVRSYLGRIISGNYAIYPVNMYVVGNFITIYLCSSNFARIYNYSIDSATFTQQYYTNSSTLEFNYSSFVLDNQNDFCWYVLHTNGSVYYIDNTGESTLIGSVASGYGTAFYKGGYLYLVKSSTIYRCPCNGTTIGTLELIYSDSTYVLRTPNSSGMGVSTASQTSGWWLSSSGIVRFTFQLDSYPANTVVIKVNGSGADNNIATVLNTDEQKVNLPVYAIYYSNGTNLTPIEGYTREAGGEWTLIQS